jgi:hypothetical protein
MAMAFELNGQRSCCRQASHTHQTNLLSVFTSAHLCARHHITQPEIKESSVEIRLKVVDSFAARYIAAALLYASARADGVTD